MADNNAQMDAETIKWLDANRKKIVFKQTDNGMELYVDNMEKE